MQVLPSLRATDSPRRMLHKNGSQRVCVTFVRLLTKSECPQGRVHVHVPIAIGRGLERVSADVEKSQKCAGQEVRLPGLPSLAGL